MARFLVFVETLNSVADESKNKKTTKPVGIVDAGSGLGISEKLKQQAREKFNLQANQSPSFLQIPRILHYLADKDLLLCGRNRKKVTADVDFNEWANCKDCLANGKKKGLINQ